MTVRNETRVAAPCLAMLLLASFACTALSDFSVHQCETNADCDTLAVGIQRCEAFRCEAGCADNHHCASFDPRTPICPSPGDPCAGLTSSEARCYVSSAYDDAAMGALTGSDMNIVGAFAPSLMSSAWLTIQLGADELNAARMASFPELAPTLVVLCDDSASTVANSVNHLIHRLGARTLIASLEDTAMTIARGQASPEGEALLLGTSSASAPPRGGDADLVWYLGGNTGDVMGTYPGLIRGVAQLVEQRTGRPRSLRIAHLISAAAEDKALSEGVASGIELEGRNADYLFREDRFRRFELSDASPDERGQTLDRLRQYAPDLILVFAGGTFDVPAAEPRLSSIMALEAPVEGAAAWSPLYILSPRALYDDTLLQVVAASPSFSARALGLSADRPADPRLAPTFRARFLAAFPQASSAGAGSSASLQMYDALYHLAYATVAAEKDPSVSPAAAILDGFARVVDHRGDRVDIGPEGIAGALEHMSNEQAFELCGTTGPARFTADHTRRADVQFFCWSSPGGAAAGDARQAIGNPLVVKPGANPAPTCAQDFANLESAP